MTTIYEIICYLLPQFHPPYHTTPYFMNDQLFILLPYFLSLLLKFSISITKEEGSYVTIQWIYQDLVQVNKLYYYFLCVLFCSDHLFVTLMCINSDWLDLWNG